jgi:hypothetical protein
MHGDALQTPAGYREQGPLNPPMRRGSALIRIHRGRPVARIFDHRIARQGKVTPCPRSKEIVMSISTVSTERRGRVLRKRAVKRLDPDSPYRLHDFLDDQKRLISSARPGLSFQTRSIQGLDADSLVFQLAPLLETARARKPAASVFTRKYGPGIGATRLAKYRLVLEFLEDLRAEIASTGLADNREPMTIHKEFVRFLLNWKVGPAQRRIPESALRRFLDEWGHRWI